MIKKPKRVAVIGLDCALPGMIEKYVAEGHLPNFKKLIDNGVIADNCLVPYPTVTPPNWAAIATGAWTGTHGITDFHVHKLGTTPVNANIVEAFSSERVKAEYIWDAADKTGKKCIVLNYPSSWPSKMKNGMVVGGLGLSVAEHRDGERELSSKVAYLTDQLITTGVYPNAVRGEFKPAAGWKNIPTSAGEPLEIEAKLNPRDSTEKLADTIWYVLVWQSGKNGYDRVTLSPERDFGKAFCSLEVGAWSPRITALIKLMDGSWRGVFFRVKLLELSDDAQEFRLFITAPTATTGWSHPTDLAEKIVSPEGITLPGGSAVRGFALGWFGYDVFTELCEFYDDWLADAAYFLLSPRDWDVFFMHCHPPDWVYHVALTEMDPNSKVSAETRAKAWEAHLRVYKSTDKMIGRIMEACGEDTLYITVSDHGATPNGPDFSPYDVLVPAGLTFMKEVKTGTGRGISTSTEYGAKLEKKLTMMTQDPDVSKSRALPQRSCYVYVNLKGRDPEGIVEPTDYEKVQQEIIDALLTYVDPKTGKRPIALALSRKDARIIGIYGEEAGDVVYALYPWFSGQHGHILPAGEFGLGSIKGLLTLTGPGIKKGYRLQRTCWLPDLVPTICYLLDLPLPKDAEGAVIYQAFEDPNFKLAEINDLKNSLQKMEENLSSSGSEK